MTPADLLAIMTFKGGAVRVKQDFTDDRAQLREVIQDLIFGEDKDGDGIPDTRNRARPSARTTASSTSSTPTASCPRCRPRSRCCGRCPSRKSLIYFASGLRLNGVDNQAQLRATINAAIRANVAIHPIDARGLVAQAPLGDATQAVARRHRRCSPASWRNAAIDELPAIAGHAVRAGEGHGRQGAVRLQRSVARHRAGGRSDHQLLHHRLLQHASGATDGRFHRVRSVADRRRRPPSCRTARVISPTRRSPSSPPPTRSGSSRTR